MPYDSGDRHSKRLSSAQKSKHADVINNLMLSGDDRKTAERKAKQVTRPAIYRRLQKPKTGIGED